MQIIFLIGRILLGGYFFYSGYNHFAHVGHLAGYTAMKKVPLPKVAVIVSGVLLVLGGAAILVNRYAILGMCLVVLFLIPTTVMMHGFWKEKDPALRSAEQIQFSKNIALIGALLLLISVG
ncbi:MAG TPA: DoxX family membrane protein [Candidatus Paceibacterota bacterium]|nr:DoxX family membrane protein [Candidatus Paceibacterota bacterium]